MRLAVTGIGVTCALGEVLPDVQRRMDAGDRGVVSLGIPGLPEARGGRVPGPKLRDWLVRRKDAKLLPRAAELVLPAAGRALAGWEGDRESLGLYFGVRREPPDDGEADAAIVASCVAGQLDAGRLAARGRDLYPPLLPLKTLPNMVLAHVSINLGVMGADDTCVGGAAAGIAALRAAMQAVSEGRCPAALAGAADSQVDGGSIRDRARLGERRVPGEAAVVLLLEPEGHPGALFHLRDGGSGFEPEPAEVAPERPHHPALGECGTADALLALALGGPGRVHAQDPDGAWASVLREP
ncbi:MAG: hypothetical protein H6741_30135 [Alphaproteobacteria bacterium]|nr:hypothetical protein [Alphaproteobacteria bacterium]